MKLEETILNSFKKKLGKEVEGLDLMVAFTEDTWPDEDGHYQTIVMDKQSNGKVWDCECTRNGNIKDYFEV